MAKELAAKEMKRLPEFVNCTEIGQSVAGQATAFKTNENGEFVTLMPAMIRAKPGGEWHAYDGLAFAMSTDVRFKLNEKRSTHVGQWLMFQLVDKEATTKGSKKKIFKVLILEDKEVAALKKKAIDKTAERAGIIERSGGSVVPPLFPVEGGAAAQAEEGEQAEIDL